MKQTEKQQQRQHLKQAVNEFLSRGGVIKKIETTQIEQNKSYAMNLTDFTQFLDHQLTDDLDFFATLEPGKTTEF